MSRRRRRQEEHENTDRWLVSYADFITLLFAFFVVMYSMSSINEGKYRVLSDTMEEAFKTPPKSPDPIQIGKERKTLKTVETTVNEISLIGIKPDIISRAQQMERIADDLQKNLAPLVNKKLIKITRDKLWVKVEMNNRILFASGKAHLSERGYPILEELAEVVRNLPNHIDVEGHTDNRPISTPTYPSNWELSAARAASVVHLFTRNGVDPKRLSAIGYGQFRPVADNNTAQGRRRNRRVVVVILADKNARRMMEIEQK
ncbi:Flagellar motor rotation protein MotB [hydrothermal vent metagenome]|uniref:Flagellar motor rotation protein MotB n=1 Tax=hydrothermal vent metagenome TaxID=652676 RepID=A0A3B1B651_9ZZZZ